MTLVEVCVLRVLSSLPVFQIIFLLAHVLIQTSGRGHGCAVLTHLTPTSEVGSSNPIPYCGKVGSCLLMVGSLQYRTLTICTYWSFLPTKLPVMI